MTWAPVLGKTMIWNTGSIEKARHSYVFLPVIWRVDGFLQGSSMGTWRVGLTQNRIDKKKGHLKSGLSFLMAHFGPHNSAISCLIYGGSSGDLALRRKPGNPDVERIRTHLWGRGSVLGHVWLMAQVRIASLAWHVLGRIYYQPANNLSSVQVGSVCVISDGAFDPQQMVSNWDPGRREASWTEGNWWINGLWLAFYQNIWESTVAVETYFRS